MQLEIISWNDLAVGHQATRRKLEDALLQTGIVGVKDVPQFERVMRTYIEAARAFSGLDETIKRGYAPDRDAGVTEGYELGAEWFKNSQGEWQIDDKKASYYAYVPDHSANQWPLETDLKTPYLALGALILETGKKLLDVMQMTASAGLHPDTLTGYGRMLHYHKECDATNTNPDWCGGHVDHGLFTGLAPAFYFREGILVDEPEEAGLFIIPTGKTEFEKVHVPDKSIVLFQTGEFGQLLSNDRIMATRHKVKKAKGSIERFTFALFHLAREDFVIQSRSILAQDERYTKHQSPNGSISHGEWYAASYERYRAK